MRIQEITKGVLSWVSWEAVLIACVIITFAFLLRKIFAKYLLSFVKNIIDKQGNRYLDAIFQAMTKPTQGLIILIGFHLAFKQFNATSNVEEFWSHLFRSTIVFLIALAFYSLSGKSSIVFEKLTNRFDVNIDKILIPLMCKLHHFIVIALAVSIIAQEWGFDVNGFVAGLGIGGLAIALAAKDTLASLFASLMIITEKPFSIGDWIETPKGGGIVEDISFRSTRIRTFEQSVIIIPNSLLANEYITNWSKMNKRKIAFDFSLPTTISKEEVKQVIQNIEQSISKHPSTLDEGLTVHLEKVETANLTLHIHFFTEDTEKIAYTKTKEDINFSIFDIINDIILTTNTG